jgi:hypothetical protein
MANRPHWEFGGTFDAAWHGIEILLGGAPDLNNPTQNLLGECARMMQEAHVVNLDLAQFHALPTALDDLTDYAPDPHTAFPIIYVSIGDELIAGLLIAAEIDTGGGEPDDPDFDFVVVPFWNYADEQPTCAVPVAVIDMTARRYRNLVRDYLNYDEDDEYDNTVTRTMLQVLKVVRFLESANVDLEQTPVSRQVRRSSERKGTQISLTVTVRSPRRHQTPSSLVGEGRDYSHRFEVRGHYKHFGPDTRLFRATQRDRPNKILKHPTRGQIVRIWCPDFVKGPDDKPLVPKVRIVPNERKEQS